MHYIFIIYVYGLYMSPIGSHAPTLVM